MSDMSPPAEHQLRRMRRTHRDGNHLIHCDLGALCKRRHSYYVECSCGWYDWRGRRTYVDVQIAAHLGANAAPPAALEEQPTPRFLPRPRRLWVHSGPCIYCAHGPNCPSSEPGCGPTDSPYYSQGDDYPGPVCGNCSQEIKRSEIAADPYYSGGTFAEGA